MTSRVNAILARLDAGEDSGDLVHLTARRQPGTPAHGKLGSVIAFQKAGMDMAVLLLSLRPGAGQHPMAALLRDRLLFTVAPLQYVTPSMLPFHHWQAMEAGEAEALTRCWFEGEEHHLLLCTFRQQEAWDAAASSFSASDFPNITTHLTS